MIPRPAYITSGPHLSGYRVTLGYETLAEASEAHAALARQAAVSTAEQVGTQSPLGDEVNPTPSQQQEPGQ